MVASTVGKWVAKLAVQTVGRQAAAMVNKMVEWKVGMLAVR